MTSFAGLVAGRCVRLRSHAAFWLSKERRVIDDLDALDS